MTGPASLVFVDIETTGLDPLSGQMLEIGLATVDQNLEVINWYSEIIKPEKTVRWDDLTPAVRDMHTDNGLREMIEAGKGLRKKSIEDFAVAWLKNQNASGLPMAGNTVASFDRQWLKAHMPWLEAEFHYRNVDVSTIKECCRRWNPRIFEKAPVKKELHRVTSDIVESIGELNYYMDEFFMVDF